MNKTILLSAGVIAAGMVIAAIVVSSGMARLGESINRAAYNANPAHATFTVKLANWDDGLRLKPIAISNAGSGALRVEDIKK